MGPKRKKCPSTPSQRKAKTIVKKYGKRMSPEKREIIRKALFRVSQSVSLRKAANDNDLPYSV